MTRRRILPSLTGLILSPEPLPSKISSPQAPKEGLARAKLVISSVTASYANQPTYFQIIIISSSFVSASVRWCILFSYFELIDCLKKDGTGNCSNKDLIRIIK